MPKQHYHQQLSTLIDNTLLHLYSHVAISRRFVPTAKRNTILCQYLKPKIKQPQHKSIKGDIKRMVIAGQKAGANLELKLEELRKMANDYKESINDAQRLYDLLNHLFDEHGFDSRLFHEGEKTEPEIIYILKDHLEHCFEEGGEQIAPVSLLIEFEQNTPDILINIINQTCLFCASLHEHNTETKQTHVHLNPYRNT
ncbi:DUF2913 family protein [Photobacterium leiognathi]|uniref:DUF2913 family protein n=1 Tax=Photobacterium leiognathi TaxID=553611 RepID=UPI00273A4165|nr:DUF2913 family protein [Photobacterium leiognathi]